MIRAGLRSVLEANQGWEVVAEAEDGEKAIAKAMETRPDVAIVDYFLPVFNGAEVTRQIKSRLPNTEILIFTLSDDDAVVGEALNAGARGFVLKNEGNEALVAAVIALTNHRPSFSGQLSERLVQSYLLNNRSGAIETLTPRERTVVQLIAEGSTNQQIARLLKLSVKTIETHRSTAMAKIGANSTADIVRYAIKHKLSEL
jgi:DNA-binding NarL/FixJ family response regulator